VSGRGLLVAAALVSSAGVHAAPVPPGSATLGKAKRPAGTGVLNLNSATLDQLDALPGISPKVAAAVVAERSTRPFNRPEDVLRVRGVSQRRFGRLRSHLTVTGATTFTPAARSSPRRLPLGGTAPRKAPTGAGAPRLQAQPPAPGGRPSSGAGAPRLQAQPRRASAETGKAAAPVHP
jgi:competence protein ComEA